MLEIRNLEAGYGPINVLWDVSLSIAEGRVTTIIGPNGAGKTTLLRAIVGLLQPRKGEILFRDRPIHGMAPWHLLEAGIAMIPEGRMIFRDMTVEDNLILGAFPKARRAGVARNLERAYTLFPRLRERRRQLAGTLSGGEGQMLAMARGLMSEPQLLLIDEPSLGLAPVIVNELFEIIADLKAEGRTIVLVEQNTHKAVGVADEVYLMLSGKVAWSAPARDVDLAVLHDLNFSR